MWREERRGEERWVQCWKERKGRRADEEVEGGGDKLIRQARPEMVTEKRGA